MLKIGDIASDVSFKVDDHTVRLSGWRGGYLVLYFYP